jgi:hypothetical protein
MSKNTVLDGRGLFLVNLFGGFMLSCLSYFFSTISFSGSGGLGFSLAWIFAFPIFVPIAAFLLWLLHTIFIWAWRSRSDKRVLVLAAFVSVFVLIAPYFLNLHSLRLWESHWSFLISGAMLLWSGVLAAMRLQLWLEQEMMEKARREDSF